MGSISFLALSLPSPKKPHPKKWSLVVHSFQKKAPPPLSFNLHAIFELKTDPLHQLTSQEWARKVCKVVLCPQCYEDYVKVEVICTGKGPKTHWHKACMVHSLHVPRHLAPLPPQAKLKCCVNKQGSSTDLLQVADLQIHLLQQGFPLRVYPLTYWLCLQSSTCSRLL
mgnify:CR=1 FL=1